MAFMGIPLLLGSHATIARKIDEMHDQTGIDGILFSWPHFVPGIRQFGEEVMPLLKCLKAAWTRAELI